MSASQRTRTTATVSTDGAGPPTPIDESRHAGRERGRTDRRTHSSRDYFDRRDGTHGEGRP